ncbi:MAG: DNA helicase UvrD [Candidatus Terrybacteria bacterium RIFCSPLOWO2_01_FULL_58_14]|uniref:DNA helicase UvrD n=2 Tax=Candidatus Terryibacteriota TaxID=1817920 RepID=A0A1G2Q0E2_9BACT|nr:MAG: DNA helicase UvrD [Candidatus Terrybacteria bacterium RIFCSPHIGHO2_01_FULL_58_15]OHA54038.1 MAG: DNA helicase UvrD [Candidatus Terrybacteria bacterium RIFCSPLOWO2_01_FULL_58_14]
MRYFADLHIHSRFARATSKDLTLSTLDAWARKKGIRVLGTGDFTHPEWFAELQDQLQPAPEEGLYVLKNPSTKTQNPNDETRFLLSVEVSSIYRKGDKVRRIHTIVLLPSFAAAETFNTQLARQGGNLRSDGRPILGIDAKAVAQAAFQAHPDALVVPAHAWTPWFSIFGSMSGFDRLDECFEELTPQIFAIETGLSSDPAMNWRISALDSVALMSNSDSHSAPKIGRELNELEGEVSYMAIREAFRTGAPARAGERETAPAKLLGTVEFFPEEGKYHYDGHRLCRVRWTPEERKAYGGRCSACGRPVTVGVMSRVDDLADRPLGFHPPGAPNYRSLVSLDEIIADAIGLGRGTKGVAEHYERLVRELGNEMRVLLDAPGEEIARSSLPVIAEGVRRVREGKLVIEPGYDGEFGTVHVFTPEERAAFAKGGAPDTQATLF